MHLTAVLNGSKRLLQASLPSNPSPVPSPGPTESVSLLEVLGSQSPTVILKNNTVDSGGGGRGAGGRVPGGGPGMNIQPILSMRHWPLASPLWASIAASQQ